MQILEKLQQLKSKFIGNRGEAQDIAVIDGWIEQAKRLFLIKSLKDHDGIKYVTQIFSSEVEKINAKLLSADSKTLPDKERDRLIDRRDLADKYLKLFLTVEEELEEIEEAVDKEPI